MVIYIAFACTCDAQQNNAVKTQEQHTPYARFHVRVNVDGHGYFQTNILVHFLNSHPNFQPILALSDKKPKGDECT